MSLADGGRTGFFLHPAAALHDPGWGHPEHQGRLRALASKVGKDLLVLHGRVEQVAAEAATEEHLARVHSREHIRRVRTAAKEAEEAGQVEVGPETPLSGASWEAVLGSSGAVLEAMSRVGSGRLRNAFVAARPPGHHASAAQAMGFCPINHVAVAVRHLQTEGLAHRVAVVDWDVHHGNGTQEIFYRDPSVFYLSIHQAPFFPGTGAEAERGEGEGEGTTLNVPVPAGISREAYLRRFREALEQAERLFTPDFVVVSAGYDALAEDPLGGLPLRPEDFGRMTEAVAGWAERACSSRVVAVLEGGYHPEATGEAVVATLRTLAGVSHGPDGKGGVT